MFAPRSVVESICAFCLLLGLFLPVLPASVVVDPWVNPIEDSDFFGGLDDGIVVSHAFVQTGDELRLFSDVSQYEKATKKRDDVPQRELQFEPEMLDFGEKFIGSPSVKNVKIRNPSSDSVTFYSVSGSTNQFHCSFPREKIINAGEFTTFEVVYLPRSERRVQITIYIHSSLGVHAFVVVGIGKPSPYRIRPFVAARLPCNGTFISPITVHNPHAEPLKITQVFSSGGDVHLEMPGGDARTGGDADLWEIPPFSTKTVMNAKLVGAQERNATSFIAIRTNLKPLDGVPDAENAQEETLFVPVDMEITRAQGLYASSDKLDFGLIKAGEASQFLTIEVVSTLDKSVELNSVFVEDLDTPHNEIYIEYASTPPITVISGARSQPGTPVAVAKVRFNSTYVLKHFDRDGASDDGAENARIIKFRGRIITTNSDLRFQYNATIEYEASVYFGELLHNPDDIAFHEQLQPPITRGVSLTNHLPFGLAIYKVLMAPEGRQAFSVKLTAPVVHIAAGETLPALLLHYNEKRNGSFATKCRIFTNVTQFNIPIVIFNGNARITLYSIDQTQFDFGLVDRGDQRSILFAITNDNPVPLTVKTLTNALPSITHLSLVGLESGNETVLAFPETSGEASYMWHPGSDFSIPHNSFAVFNYTLVVPRDRSVFRGTFTIETNFEMFEFPVRYQIEDGQIVVAPDIIKFQNAFPGSIQKQPLAVYSSFAREMQVLRLSTLENDRRVFFDAFDPEKPLILKPNNKTNLGNVMFMPEVDCWDLCYSGMTQESGDEMWFKHGLLLPHNLADVDGFLYRRLRNRYVDMINSGRQFVNTTVVIDTREAKHIHVPVQAELAWPRLLTRPVIQFPLTAVGNFTILNLTLQNPSTKPIMVQILPLVIYPDAEKIIEILRDDLPSPLTEPIEMNETLMFSLRDTELFPLKPGSPVPSMREHLEAAINITVPKFTLSMMLQPQMKVRVRLGFLPTDYELRSSLLLIRNNLTAIEPVVIYGKGAKCEMRIDNRTARSRKDPLLFEIQPHHLDDCSNPNRQMHKLSTTLTVKRLFSVVNTGDIPFTVTNVSINGAPCENRGFRVINCYPFRLLPNESYSLEIAHTPDFLQTWNEASLHLYMHMNNSAWIFPMASSLPSSMLAKCHRALPRPPFESLMYYSCVSALVFCLICIVACAYLEGDRMIDTMIRQQYAAPRKVFDLNAPTEDDQEAQDTRNNNSGKKAEAAEAARRKANVREKEVNRRPGRVTYDNNSNVVVKSFWEAINFVLWLFSHIWITWRSETKLIESMKAEKKKRKKRGPVVTPKEAASSSSTNATPPAPDAPRRTTKKLKASKTKSDAAQNAQTNGVHKQNGVDAEIRKVESIMDNPISAPKAAPAPSAPKQASNQKAPVSKRNSNASSVVEGEGEFVKVKKSEWLKLCALNTTTTLEVPANDRPTSRAASEVSNKSRKPRSSTDSSSQVSSATNSAIGANQKRSNKKRGGPASVASVVPPPAPPKTTPSEDEVPSEMSEEAPDWAEYQAISDDDLDKDFSDLVTQTQILEHDLTESEESTPTHQKNPRPGSLAPLQMPMQRFDPSGLTEASIREAQKQLDTFQLNNILNLPKLDNAPLFSAENLWTSDFGLNGNGDQYMANPSSEFSASSAFDSFLSWSPPAPLPGGQPTSPRETLETTSVETPRHSNGGAFGAIGTRPNMGIFQSDGGIWAPMHEELPISEPAWASLDLRDIWGPSPSNTEREQEKRNPNEK